MRGGDDHRVERINKDKCWSFEKTHNIEKSQVILIRKKHNYLTINQQKIFNYKYSRDLKKREKER